MLTDYSLISISKFLSYAYAIINHYYNGFRNTVLKLLFNTRILSLILSI